MKSANKNRPVVSIRLLAPLVMAAALFTGVAHATVSQAYEDPGFDANAALDRLEKSLDATSPDAVRVSQGAAPQRTAQQQQPAPSADSDAEQPGWGN